MNASLCSLLITAVLATSVNAHGQMTDPKPREVTAKFLADSGALKNADKNELQWAPLENLSQRKQKDFPEAATFDIMNGCRGMVYEAGGPVTEVATGATLPVKWFIQAPHPGYAEFSIVKPKTGAGGKIMYEKVTTLKRIENFATTGGNGGSTVTIPTDITGCEKAGDCALQMYWHSDIANQTYPTCADIIIKGSGASTGGGSSTPKTPAVAPTSKKPATSSKTSTKAPAKKTSSRTPAPVDSDTTGGDWDAVTAPAPAPTKKKRTTTKTNRFRA